MSNFWVRRVWGRSATPHPNARSYRLRIAVRPHGVDERVAVVHGVPFQLEAVPTLAGPRPDGVSRHVGSVVAARNLDAHLPARSGGKGERARATRVGIRRGRNRLPAAVRPAEREVDVVVSDPVPCPLGKLTSTTKSAPTRPPGGS